ncbi:excinuclease ABC subunit A [Brevibacterium sanguinis]|uniref:UvrABC system protein A n=2 Tax=Brevibacterium TaxID=1696 RepID=A0A366IL90_9MICO|nr:MULTISPECIES: ATP-binding cassette domain-containing protein [Brevibacterium]RBP66956.1 excinuclease ABC subunit A [Brevibacterium sanguinis]RBP73481.1 excinuclease ABC subunit A [Brevibacterium celere]
MPQPDLSTETEPATGAADRTGPLDGRGFAFADGTGSAAGPGSAPVTGSVPVTELTVVGAREHNLADITVALPHGQLIAICGVSGSGKSSLAFDTIYAEAQRRYLESVSPFTRHLLGTIAAPEVDRITGLPAAIAVRQLVTAAPDHSSVGTLSQVSDLLRVLFSRIGTYPPGLDHLPASAFSPNTVEGACPTCAAKGSLDDIDLDAAVPDDRLTIRDGAIAAWPGGWLGRNFKHLVETMGIDIDLPFRELPESTRTWLLLTDETPTITVDPASLKETIARGYKGKFRSARRYLLDTMVTTGSRATRERTAQFLRHEPCPECGGARISRAALGVRIGGETIAEVASRSLDDLARFIRSAVTSGQDSDGGPGRADAASEGAAGVLLDELAKRTRVISELGVGYLAPNRPASTLSPGELQRLRLAAHLHSGLHGMLYVFDELSTGLHPADTDHLFGFIEALRDAGNTVVLVEHEMETVRRCDWVVELGPGGGDRGGTVMFSGPVADALAGDSGVAARLRNEPDTPPWRPDPTPANARQGDGSGGGTGSPASGDSAGRGGSSGGAGAPESGWARCSGLRANTLADVTVEFPTAALTVVTGVSGSGKSSLLRSVAALVSRSGATSLLDDDEPAALDADLGFAEANAVGLEEFSRVVSFDQSVIGRSPRSVIGTYLGIFDRIRALFAATPLARSRGYTASRFSFNTAEGRCPRCEGLGMITIDLVHLPASSGSCPECEGRRFTDETLQVTVEGLTIAEVLGLSIDAAAVRFAEVLRAVDHFEALQRVGLGGLLLGQSTSTLSGGEAQRLRLAAAMRARRRRERSLFILDEPTNGLHPSDARVLGELFRQIVDEGDTILMADHNMEIAAGADWLIDLGPGAGPEGGGVVAAGRPKDVARSGAGATARVLTERFG